MRTTLLLIALSAVGYFQYADAAPAPIQAPGDRPALGTYTSPDGKYTVSVALPPAERKANIASRGLGCCVFRSIDHAARWQNVPQLRGFPEWMKENGVPGGGYPSKVDQLIPLISKDRNLPAPKYVQYEGGDYEIIRRILESGRMACVTYNGHDPFYGLNATIAHMVNVVFANAEWVAVFDNNHVGDLMWMSPPEFMKRFTSGGYGWAVCLLNGPPPPSPWN